MALTIPDVEHLYQPLEYRIRHHLILSVTECSTPESDLVLDWGWTLATLSILSSVEFFALHTVQLDLNFMNTRVCNSARTTRV